MMVEAAAGQTIYPAARTAITAAATGRQVHVRFNDTDVPVFADDTESTVHERWNRIRRATLHKQ
jgi:hypothetical protein